MKIKEFFKLRSIKAKYFMISAKCVPFDESALSCSPGNLRFDINLCDDSQEAIDSQKKISEFGYGELCVGGISPAPCQGSVLFCCHKSYQSLSIIIIKNILFEVVQLSAWSGGTLFNE